MDKRARAFWKKAAHSRHRELEQLFKEAGFPVKQWMNGVPVFDGDVDWQRVQEIASQPDMVTPITKAKPDPLPARQKKRKKKGGA